jgi:hypothetical protein
MIRYDRRPFCQPAAPAQSADHTTERCAKAIPMSDHELTPITRKDGVESLPARGYTWPPFEDGNTAALVHGAYSESAITARAAHVAQNLFEIAPWLADDEVYVIPVARFVRVEARSQLLAEAIADKSAEKGILSVGARMIEAAAATDRLAAKLGDDLGLSPLGKARLKTLTAAGELGVASLVDLAERGNEIRQRRQAERKRESADEA